MLPSRSIKSLYPLALAEGEGVGTAYEYVAKRQVLRRFLRERPAGTLLVAGLPEIYGSSLDYFLLAHELGLRLLVVDDQPDLLTKAEKALRQAQTLGHLVGLSPTFQQTPDLAGLAGVEAACGWVICNEVLQRFEPADRERYVERCATLAPVVTLFAPNGDNSAHTTQSGLAGLSLAELAAPSSRYAKESLTTGYCDMPPFPPGVTRSAEQREQAESGWIEAFAMWGLGRYAALERFFPAGWQRQRAHIVYACFTSR